MTRRGNGCGVRPKLWPSCWRQPAAIRPLADGGAATRARALTALGFAPLDALHLAFAEQSEAKWFVTTDDRLLKRAATYQDRLRVQVRTPDGLPLSREGDQE